MNIIPPYIEPGNTIGIVSTASVINQSVVEPAVELLQSLGYKVQLGSYVFSKNGQFAGTDQQRASDLQLMLDNPEVKAIICSRGGYGSLRTSELINWSGFAAKPKWIVGFSDVTALHAKIQQLGIASIHGPMPKHFTDNEQPSVGFRFLIDALNGKKLSYKVESSEFNRPGKASAPVVGGNLSMIYSLRGTPYDIDTNGKILFIEDLGEYLYHLDRMMMNLKTGGKLENLAGLIVGHFTGMKDHPNKFGKTLEEIITDAIKDYAFPVMFNFEAGHQNNNFPLKLGAEAKIVVNPKKSTFVQ
ncbi:MAG: LD-carboxypeptidase [Prolixibacteraceae bacterium]|nr:LD-carboxypeptidase [Prolixibacteraceae bacterium]